MSDIVTVISNVGFPIACVVFMGYYVRELTSSHKLEIEQLTTKIGDMCLSIQKLTDKVEQLINERGEK